MAYSARARRERRSRKAKTPYVRFHRIFGRCRLCRLTVARFLAFWEGRRGAALSVTEDARPSLFTDACVASALDNLRAVGYSPGYRLPSRYVEDILQFARATPCYHTMGDGERFLIADVSHGRSPSGHAVAVADVDLSWTCHAIDEIAFDNVLLSTVRGFLGYMPRQVIRRLYWSPVSTLSDEIRHRSGQTVDFHYDIDPAHSLYVYFYITGADLESGAHVVLPRTHRAKPLSILFSSCFQPDERLARLYPTVEPVVIEGQPGFGFVEDPGCFHKALAPAAADRLILQLRYS